MQRLLETKIIRDLDEKVVLLSGPRQSGKTTLSKQIYPDYEYINYDVSEDRLILMDKSWDRKKPLVIFDEIHKMREWKRWVKGVYDTEQIPPRLMVTGSARLDVYQKVGDSLAGRYFQYRLHPLDMKEIITQTGWDSEQVFDTLFHCSGFPEPYLKGQVEYYNRWRRSHLDIILRQDLLDISSVRDIKSIETLVSLLKQRVGSTISYANLARDLECDAKTIKRWLLLLENLYVIYRVTPYHKNIARSLLKEPKYYFYDHAQAEGNGAKLENIVASALQKELHYLEDTTGKYGALHYLRTKDGREIDFLVSIDQAPVLMLEVKYSNPKPSHSFTHFNKYLPNVKMIQLVKNIKREATYPNDVEVRALVPWLASISL